MILFFIWTFGISTTIALFCMVVATVAMFMDGTIAINVVERFSDAACWMIWPMVISIVSVMVLTVLGFDL